MGRSFGAGASWMQGDARERRRPSGPASIAGGDPAPRGARIRTVGPPQGALRLVALWLLLFAVYLVGNEPPRGSELEYLRIADALGDEVVRSPLGLGFPLLISPFGASAAAVVLAGVAALGFVLAALLARRIVPEPYASAGAALAGLSAPAVEYAATIRPGMTAATLLAGATLCAVTARDTPRPVPVFGAAAMLAVLPWLDPLLVVPAVPVAVALYLWCRTGRRGTMGLIAVELAAASVVVYVTLNEELYGGPTPWAAASVPAAEYLERLPRDASPWLELLPIFALVAYAAWLLWRSRAEGLARLAGERATAEAAAALALAVAGSALVVAVADARLLVAALPVAGALAAWTLRHAPKLGAVLGALTLAITAYQLLNA